MFFFSFMCLKLVVRHSNLRKNGYAFDKLWLYCSFIWLSVTYVCKKKKKSNSSQLSVRHSNLRKNSGHAYVKIVVTIYLASLYFPDVNNFVLGK
jgi:hypothetical protein